MVQIKNSYIIRAILILFGLNMFFFSFSEFYQRANINIHGTVLKSSTKCSGEYNNRCSTTYIVSSDDQTTDDVYIAGANDHSLSMNIPIGSTLSKNKWEIGYKVNESYVLDFPIKIYLVQLIFGFITIIQGLIVLPSIFRTFTSNEYWTSK